MIRSLLWALCLCLPALVFAHGLQIDMESSSGAVVVRCVFTNGEPADAEVLVYSPTEPDRIFQMLRTDLRGFASFVPDAPGDWRVVADDGMGHRTFLDVPITELGVPVTAKGAMRSQLLRYLGAAALLALVAGWFWRTRRSTE